MTELSLFSWQTGQKRVLGFSP